MPSDLTSALEAAGVELKVVDEPHPEARNLHLGDTVKLVFQLRQPLSDGTRGERMWVHVTRVVESGYVGLLANDPHVLNLDPGVEITFQPSHVVELWEGNDLSPKVLA